MDCWAGSGGASGGHRQRGVCRAEPGWGWPGVGTGRRGSRRVDGGCVGTCRACMRAAEAWGLAVPWPACHSLPASLAQHPAYSGATSNPPTPCATPTPTPTPTPLPGALQAPGRRVRAAGQPAGASRPLLCRPAVQGVCNVAARWVWGWRGVGWVGRRGLGGRGGGCVHQKRSRPAAVLRQLVGPPVGLKEQLLLCICGLPHSNRTCDRKAGNRTGPTGKGSGGEGSPAGGITALQRLCGGWNPQPAASVCVSSAVLQAAAGCGGLRAQKARHALSTSPRTGPLQLRWTASTAAPAGPPPRSACSRRALRRRPSLWCQPACCTCRQAARHPACRGVPLPASQWARQQARCSWRQRRGSCSRGGGAARACGRQTQRGAPAAAAGPAAAAAARQRAARGPKGPPLPPTCHVLPAQPAWMLPLSREASPR